MRILDIFFYEGYETTFLFKVALAILRLNEDLILEHDDSITICNLLKRADVDCETLLEVFR